MINVIGNRRNRWLSFLSGERIPALPTHVGDVQAAALTNHPKHGGSTANYIKAGSHADVRAELSPKPQKGVASQTLVSSNTPMWVVTHSYHSGEPMVGFLDKEPPGSILRVRLTVTPSGHDGFEKAKGYAAENTYNARVGYMEGSRFVELEAVQFDGEGKPTTERSVQKDRPHWAATSPEFVVDLKKFRADHPGENLVVQGWPSFSAGVFGYREARETQIRM